MSDQEHKLLSERANEISLVLQQTVTSVSTQMTSLGRLVRAGEDPSLFLSEASADLTSPSAEAVALLQAEAGTDDYRVVAAVGRGLKPGESLSGAAAAAAALSGRSPGLVATPVYRAAAGREVGFALSAGSGAVVYRQSILGPPRPARSSSSAFSDVRVVLYAADRPDPGQVLVTTAAHLPLSGSVLYQPYLVGSSHWLLGTQAAQPLVGSVAAAAPWAVLGAGLVGTALVLMVVESTFRRRDAALALYRSEHRFAEALQNRLLRPLEAPRGLEVASRYVAASDGQKVGGDWFDLFDLGQGRVGVVIGDVMGHDVEAAAAMAQIRAGLRAYAVEAGSPAEVVGRLGTFVETFQVALIVTVVYGVLGGPAADGSRLFTWANAGHLPPVLRLAGGGTVQLDGGSSPMLGAPYAQGRPECRVTLPAGATLLLYTDGLVETHSTDLGQSIDLLCSQIEAEPARDVEPMCEAVLGWRAEEQRHDDIALIAVRIPPLASGASTTEGPVTSAR
ncbi:MAG: serine/threonine-protein phosphatase [Acidobacteriota bacterium]|nr:serine/threonine-protein phosphatase [Acidobacteriota bacterium]